MRKSNFFSTVAAVALLLCNGAFFSTNAQVTIGSNKPPQATLDIISDTANVKGNGFRLIDGNQAENEVLTSDANGFGTWRHLYYTPDSGAIINNVVALPTDLQGSWSITYQSGVRVGAVCQIRVTLRYTGTTDITFADYNASSIVPSGIILNIINPDFIPLETAYTIGYIQIYGGGFRPAISAVTPDGNFLFRYIQAPSITTGTVFYCTVQFVPQNYQKVGGKISNN